MAPHARLTVVLLTGALAMGACADKPVATDRSAPAVTTATMTREVSPRLRRVCASAARKGTAAVRCPRLVPAGTTSASVLLPRRSVVRPGAAGDDGRRRFRGPRDFYVIEAYARSLRPEGHWLTAAGSARSLEERALRSAGPPRVERVRVAGRELELRRYPPYPAGGVNGGHVVAIARAAGQFTYVSVHGHHHADVAIAMLVDLLADSPAAARARLGTPRWQGAGADAIVARRVRISHPARHNLRGAESLPVSGVTPRRARRRSRCRATRSSP